MRVQSLIKNESFTDEIRSFQHEADFHTNEDALTKDSDTKKISRN
jgi:hypothetical protein